MKERWKLCLLHKGRRLDKELLRKIKSTHKDTNWKIKKSSIARKRVSYNDKFVMRLKARDLKEKNRKIKEQKEIENEAKRKYEHLMKLKPKEYKNIPNNEKYEIKFSYDYQKAKREALEEKAKEIEKMTALQYLETLNDDIKEKLIGLCLDKNITESLSNDSTENYDDDQEVEEEDEEDEEQIE